MAKESWVRGILESTNSGQASALHIGTLSGISIKRYNELLMSMKAFAIDNPDINEMDDKLMKFVKSLHLNNIEMFVMGSLVGVAYTAEGVVPYGKWEND